MSKGFFTKRANLHSKDKALIEGDWGLRSDTGTACQHLSIIAYITEKRHGNCDDDHGDTRTISSFSTNATADDIPGTGRILDKLYQYLGRKIERSILKLRMRCNPPHPNQIFTVLWSGREVYEGLIYRNEMSEILCIVHEYNGPAAITGLKSLVRQTSSESMYRSAAALMALIGLFTSNSSFSDFYGLVASNDQIFKLDTLAQSLNDSHREKKLFLSLTNLARAYYFFNSKLIPTESPKCLLQNVLKILCLSQDSSQDIILGVSKACLVLAKACRAIEARIEMKMNLETAYFLVVILLKRYREGFSLADTTRQFSRFILWKCANYVDVLLHRMFMRFENCNIWDDESLIHPICALQSLFLAHNDARIQEIFPKTHRMIDQFSIVHNDYNLQVLINGSVEEAKRIFQHLISLCIRRSRYLLESSNKIIKDHIHRNTSQGGHSDLGWSSRKKWWEHSRLSKDYGTCNNTRWSMRHSSPQRGGCNCCSCYNCPPLFSEQKIYDIRNTGRFNPFMTRCQDLHIWGKNDRNSLDWDWSPSSSWKSFPKFENPAKQLSSNEAIPVPNKASELRGETMNVSLDAVQANVMKKMRISFPTASGEVRYKEFDIDLSADSGIPEQKADRRDEKTMPSSAVPVEDLQEGPEERCQEDPETVQGDPGDGSANDGTKTVVSDNRCHDITKGETPHEHDVILHSIEVRDVSTEEPGDNADTASVGKSSSRVHDQVNVSASKDAPADANVNDGDLSDDASIYMSALDFALD